MWTAYLLAGFLASVPWADVLSNSGLEHFLQRYDRVARQRPSLLIKAEVSERDDWTSRAGTATISAVRPSTLRIDLRMPKKVAQTLVVTDRESLKYDPRSGTGVRILTNPRTPLLGTSEGFGPQERIAAWVLFGHSQYAAESFRLRMTEKTDWYVHLLGKPRDSKADVRQMEVVFNRKQMMPARVWVQYASGTQVTWLVKEAGVDRHLSAAKLIEDLPPGEPK